MTNLTSNTNWTKRPAIAGSALAIAALMFGAMTASAQPQNRGHRGFGGPGFAGPMMGKALGLTDAQKEQARSIFSEAREQSKPLGEQLRAGRKAVQEAVQSGKGDAEIDRLTAEQGALTGKVAAIHAKSQAKFWQILTPEQQAKSAELRKTMRERMSKRTNRVRDRG